MSESENVTLFDGATTAVRCTTGHHCSGHCRPEPVSDQCRSHQSLQPSRVPFGRLRASAAGIPKYYADLLEIRPGRIPLLRGPIHASIVDTVTV